MLNYREFKRLNGTMMVIFLEAVGTEEITEDSLERTSREAVRKSLLEGRDADIVSCSGFLGFMLMAKTYPKEFSKDRDFWKEVHGCTEVFLSEYGKHASKEELEIASVRPDVVMARRFTENPENFI